MAQEVGAQLPDWVDLLPGAALPIQRGPARPVDIRRMVFPASDGMTPTTLADGIAVTVQEIRKELGR